MRCLARHSIRLHVAHEIEAISSGADRIVGALDGFFPARMIARLEGDAPRQTRFAAAVLFADISGYTVLTETLLARGDEGLAQLSDLLDRAWGQYVREVDAHGGEVLYFAGDALLAYWPADSAAAMPAAAGAAVACARSLHEARVPVGEALRPQLHIGLDCGELWGSRVGGDDYAHLIFGGGAVREAARIGARAPRGRSARSERIRAALRASTSSGPSSAVRGSDDAQPVSTPSVPHAHLVPKVVLDRGAGGAWSAELRHVTSLFVQVAGFDEQAPDALRQIDAVTRTAHAALEPFSASPGRWVIDDKGLVFVAVFGLPLNAHKDDRARALKAGAAIEAALSAIGRRSAVGVATGLAFCGPIGAPFRREYVTIGRAMNLAARLMDAGEGALYAGPTAGLEQEGLLLEPAPPRRIKGFAEPVSAFRFRVQVARPSRSSPLAGRDEERATLGRALERASNGDGCAVLVQGEAGIGKSHLVADLAARAREQGVAVRIATNDPSDHAPAYSAWRPIFRDLLGIRATDDAAAARAAVKAWFEARPSLAPFAPLLQAVLRVEMPDTDVTRHLEGPARVERTARFLSELLDVALERPALVILEDGHWMDPDSWTLARAASLLHGVLVLVTTRPVPRRPEEEAFRAHPERVTIELPPLSFEAIGQMVRRCLEAESVTGGLVDTVHERSGGNPLFALEFVHLLRESQRAILQRGHWVLAQREPERSTPVSVRGLIADRVDTLGAQPVMTLKAAAAIGPRFSLSLLRRILPPEAAAAVPSSIAELESHQLVEPAADGYGFRHGLICEVVYELMLPDQRRELHAAVARALEAQAAEGDPVEASLLAHHWFLARDLPRTLRYADAAGSQALAAGAYREAAYFFGQCLECASREPTLRPDPRVLTRWHRQLADAYHGLGDLAQLRAHATRALEAAGLDPEPSPLARIASAVVHLARELVVGGVRRGSPARARPTRLPHEDLARVYEHLVELAYFDNDGLTMPWAALHAMESAGRAGQLSDLSRSYAQLGGVLGLVPGVLLPRRFVRRSLEVAKLASDPHAEAYMHMCNCLYSVGLGRWETVDTSIAECLRICARTADTVTAGNVLIVRFWSLYYRGRTEEAARTAAELQEVAARGQHEQHAAWAKRAQGLLAARANDGRRAVGLVEEARVGLEGTRNSNEMLETDGVLALALLRAGDLDGAEEAARRALDVAVAMRVPTSHGTLSGLVGALEVVFAARRAHPQEPEWTARTDAALRALRWYRFMFNVAEPAHLYWRGLARLERGDARGASADWREGLRRAEAAELADDAARLRSALSMGLAAVTQIGVGPAGSA